MAARSQSQSVIQLLHDAANEKTMNSQLTDIVTWNTLHHLVESKNDLGNKPIDIVKDDGKNMKFVQLMLNFCEQAQSKGGEESDDQDKKEERKEKKKKSAMFKFLQNLNLEQHYSGLMKDGWTTMERLRLIDDRDELKSAGITLPGEIKSLLKTLEKERNMMK